MADTYYKTPIKIIPEQYRTKTITDPSGNVINWEDANPDYEIYTDVHGRPLNYNPINSSDQVREFGTSGPAIYAGVDLAGNADTENVRQRQADEHINKEYGDKAWGKVLGSHVLAGTGIYAGLTSPIWLPKVGKWVMSTGGPAFAKHVAAPTAAGLIWDKGQEALIGTTTTKVVSDYLQKNKNVNPVIADAVGGLFNPGYWINFGGAGKYTRPIFNKVGLGPSNNEKKIELSPTIQANINSLIPKSKFQTKVVDPTMQFLDRNLYRFQQVASPWLARRKPVRVNSGDLPSFRFVRNQSELQPITDNMRYERPEVGGQVQDYSLFKSDANNKKVFGDAMGLKAPKFDVQFHDWEDPLPQLLNGISAGVAGADLIFGDSDRNPYIRGLEYLALGRYGIDALARHRVSSSLKQANNYYHRFGNIRKSTEETLNRLREKSSKWIPKGIEGRSYTSAFDRKSSMYFPEDYQFQTNKPGFNYKGATFDDLANFLNKNKSLNKNLKDYSIDSNNMYDSSGRVIARRSSNGKIDLVNEQELRNVLAKDIDIVDYATGNHFRGKIQVGDDGTVTIPEDYTRILRSNIDYVQNTLFPGSGVKVFGSSAGVTEAGFPHATHDIDFYITQNEIDKLLQKGVLSESDRINPGTYTYRHNPVQFGEQGNIDLNVLEQTPDGMATGIRAEELYRQYFPDEYFQALRDFKSRQSNRDADQAFHINKTPEELLEAMDPSSKTIMDSFDIDFTAPQKSKHALRSWAHLIYSDPIQVSKGLNQYAKSMLGSRVRLFPMTVEQLGDKELNLKALQKLGINLKDFELERIASDPQRMKNVLDAWYMMDNTAMRYIRGTWPGTTGYSSENFIKSATIWDPVNNGGNLNGAGLNTTIGGDSQYFGDLKAFISPRTEYKSSNLLDLIDEVNNNFGRNPEASTLLRNASQGTPQEQVGKLQQIFNERGWNFLQNKNRYGSGNYASATRPFNIESDYVGFSPIKIKLNPLIPRIKMKEKTNPLSMIGYASPFTRNRQIPTIRDYNRGQRPLLQEFLESNKDRAIDIEYPFATRTNFMGPMLETISVGAPVGVTGAVVGATERMNANVRNDIENFKTLSDDVVQGMDERDRQMFTPEGVDSLYQCYRQSPYYQGVSQADLDRVIYQHLSIIYNNYKNKDNTK